MSKPDMSAILCTSPLRTQGFGGLHEWSASHREDYCQVAKEFLGHLLIRSDSCEMPSQLMLACSRNCSYGEMCVSQFWCLCDVLKHGALVSQKNTLVLRIELNLPTGLLLCIVVLKNKMLYLANMLCAEHHPITQLSLVGSSHAANHPGI